MAEETITREGPGRVVHEVYRIWLAEQPQPKVRYRPWATSTPAWRELCMRIGEAVAGAERERIFAALEALVRVLGDGPAPDSEALARAKHLGKTWADLPADTAASQTLKHAGVVLLARIAGDGGPEAGR